MSSTLVQPSSMTGILPLLAGLGAATMGSGLIHTMLPLRLHQLGYANDSIGLVVTGFSVGFLAGCLGVPMLIRSVGHVRAYAAFAAVAAISILAFDWQAPIWLSTLQFACTGIAAAGLAVVNESWLNELVVPAWRARVLSLYVIELAVFYGFGQLVALDLDVLGSRMLVVAAGFYVLALIPIAALDVPAPKPPKSAQLHLLHAFHVSKVGAFSCLQTGLVTATFSGIGPLYGAALGLDQHAILVLMASMQLGGVVLQWPLGYASDRCDRRVMVVGMNIAVILLSLVLIVFGARLTLPVLAALLGGFAGIVESFYPIGVAHANDRAEPSEYVSLSSNLLLIWGVGSAIGPIVATAALDRLGAPGFFWYVVVLSAALGIYTAWRIRRSATAADEMREEFVMYPTTSPEILELVPFRKLKRPPPEAS